MNEMINSIAREMVEAKPKFIEIAPSTMSFDSEQQFAIQHLKSNAYLFKVAKDNPKSLRSSLINCANVGLSLNPIKKQAYLLPRTIKKDDGKYEKRVFLEPSYMGLCDLALSSGKILWIQARIVREKDTIIDNGPGEKPTHEYQPFGDRGKIVGVYCSAKLNNGDYLTEFMDIQKIYSVMERSEAVKKWRAEGEQAGKGGPWITDFEEMAKKTVIRNAFKMWPKWATTDQLAQAVHLSNENEGFEPINDTGPDIESYNAEQKVYFDSMIEKKRCIRHVRI